MLTLVPVYLVKEVLTLTVIRLDTSGQDEEQIPRPTSYPGSAGVSEEILLGDRRSIREIRVRPSLQKRIVGLISSRYGGLNRFYLRCVVAIIPNSTHVSASLLFIQF